MHITRGSEKYPHFEAHSPVMYTCTLICLPRWTTAPSLSQVMYAGGELSPDTH